jgi:exopolyphosphatase/guanosine-5'-triphosphate,3'-diphosphate pyrophosphatase
LQEEHQLESRYQIILYVAALLHEIGHFVSTRSHHKHAMYLIRNSELFGLGRKDHLLVSLVARYHRRSSPQPTHEGYNTLDRHERVAVAKLAAMLRVAIALDDSRSQRIHEFKGEAENGRFVISIPLVEDLSLEQMSLRQNGSLFEETFGMPVFLQASNTKIL